MRKTGKDTKIEIEVGTSFYAMSELSTVSSPAADIRKKFLTSAVYLSDQENLQPVVRLDGVVSGLTITPGTANNSVDVSAGTCYIKGVLVTVTGVTVSDLTRPTASAANVLVSALTIDENGTVNTTAASEGTTSTTRGAVGGPPFLPVDEVLIGYITMTYYEGSESGADTIETTEINSETKERTLIPSYEVLYHDGAGNNPQDYGVINFASVLPLIHAATAAGPGTACRNVYVSYYEPDFEQVPEAKDFSFNEDISTIKSKAYLDSAEETAIGTPMWSASGTVYWSKVSDLLSLVKNSKRWIKFYPDKDETPHWAGRAVVKVSRSMPTDDTLNASVTFEGSGQLYDKTA